MRSIIRSIALVPGTPKATDAFLRRAVIGYAMLAAQVVAAWKVVYPEMVAPTVRAVSSEKELVDGDNPVIFSPRIDQPGDLAYHSERDNIPYGLVLFDDNTDTPSAEQSGGHEVGEMLVDPDVDQYDEEGKSIEPFDMLENSPVNLDINDPGGTFLVSPIGFPTWFKLTGVIWTPGEPVDSEGLLTSPGQLGPGGYIAMKDGTEKFGANRSTHPCSKYAILSRRSRRRRRMGYL